MMANIGWLAMWMQRANEWVCVRHNCASASAAGVGGARMRLAQMPCARKAGRFKCNGGVGFGCEMSVGRVDVVVCANYGNRKVV
jgi:hypothetical protein